jgi:DNA-binding LacI/PurR family transcriptional regulator
MTEARGSGGSRGGRVTSVDVAREAGLSRATVSYVLNRDPRQTIPEATRQRVLDAAERLGYRPFGPARLLRGAKSSVVLMFTPGLEHASDFVAAGIINQLGVSLANQGLHLVWQLGDPTEVNPSVDLAPVVVLTSATEGDPIFSSLARQFDVPVLPAFPGLEMFIGSGATAQVEHLASRGRTSLIYAAPATPELAPTSHIRWRALLAKATELGLPEPTHFVLPPDRFDATEALSRLVETATERDGVCAFNDEVAVAFLAAAHDAGIAVPDRLAVVGIDNHPFGPYTVPALSTVVSEVDDFVERFAQSIAGIARGESPLAVALPEHAQVISRHST